MKKGGKGGSKTLTGLNFEEKVDLYRLLEKIPGYRLKKSKIRAGIDVYFEEKLVARCFRKHEFYKFLEENNVD